ncbi:MAG: hypothetical protein DRP29_03970, partial [Thermodesulfobacteriota bacterium]
MLSRQLYKYPSLFSCILKEIFKPFSPKISSYFIKSKGIPHGGKIIKLLPRKGKLSESFIFFSKFFLKDQPYCKLFFKFFDYSI